MAIAVFFLAVGAAAPPVQADSDTALGVVGGLMVGKMISDRNQQRQQQAYNQGQRDRYYAEQQRRYDEQQRQQYQYQQQQQQQQQQKPSVEDRLTQLKSYRDRGLISNEDYEQRKAEILRDL